MNPQSAAIARSGNPLKAPFDSENFQNPPMRSPIHLPHKYSPILKYAIPLFTVTARLTHNESNMNVATLPRDPLDPRAFSIKKARERGNDALQTLLLLFKCITSETKESCVSRTDALLVGTGDGSKLEYRRSGTLGKLSDSRLMYRSNRSFNMPPPGNPRAFDFFENYCSNSPLPGPKCHSNAPH